MMNNGLLHVLIVFLLTEVGHCMRVRNFTVKNNDTRHFLDVNITTDSRYCTIGSRCRIECTWSITGSSIQFGFSSNVDLKTQTFQSFDNITKNIEKTANDMIVYIDPVPEKLRGRRTVICNSTIKEGDSDLDLEVFYFGVKPPRIKAIECEGTYGSKLTCNIKRQSIKLTEYESKHNTRLAIEFISNGKSAKTKVLCVNSTTIRKRSPCKYRLLDNEITIDHDEFYFTWKLDIDISYCNHFGCVRFHKSFNRSSVEKPSQLCIANKTANLDGFYYEIGAPKSVYGPPYMYSLECRSKRSSKNFKFHEATGSIHGLLGGTLYRCRLTAAFTFTSKRSESCAFKIKTIEKNPDTGPRYLPGMFSKYDSQLQLCYLPPYEKNQNGEIVEYGVSESETLPPRDTSDTCCIRTINNKVFYLFSRNSCGWSKNATKVVIPPKDKIIPSPILELWEIETYKYRPDITFDNNNSPSDINQWIFIICDAKSKRNCRAEIGRNRTIKAELPKEEVAVLIWTSDGRTSTLDRWIQHYCLDNEAPKLKQEWVKANLIDDANALSILIEIETVHLHCTASSKSPISALEVVYTCENFSKEYKLNRSATVKSSLKIPYGTKQCYLEVGLKGNLFPVRIHETGASKVATSSHVGLIAVLSCIAAVIFSLCIVWILRCVYMRCRKWYKKASDNPEDQFSSSRLTPRSSEITDPKYQLQNTETTVLPLSVSGCNDHEVHLLTDDDHNLSQEESCGGYIPNGCEEENICITSC